MRRTFLLAAAAALLGMAAEAAELSVANAYARSTNPRSGAVFLTVVNKGEAAERLVAVRSDAARKVEVHTTIMQDGVARMRPVEGIDVPAGGAARLMRGGDHVMLMGLTTPLKQGDEVALTLVFESGAELGVNAFVDNERPAMDGGAHGNGGHGSGG